MCNNSDARTPAGVALQDRDCSLALEQVGPMYTSSSFTALPALRSEDHPTKQIRFSSISNSTKLVQPLPPSLGTAAETTAATICKADVEAVCQTDVLGSNNKVDNT